MKPRSMGSITSTVFVLEKSHPLVSHQLNPRSCFSIRVSSSTAASVSMAALGPLCVAIVTGTIRAFINIHFTVAQNICFIASLFTIWEQMGLYIIKILRSVVRVLGLMIPKFSLRNIPKIGSVWEVVAVICQENYVQEALRERQRSY